MSKLKNYIGLIKMTTTLHISWLILIACFIPIKSAPPSPFNQSQDHPPPSRQPQHRPSQDHHSYQTQHHPPSQSQYYPTSRSEHIQSFQSQHPPSRSYDNQSPSENHHIEFIIKKKTTGKESVQLIVNNTFTFLRKTSASAVGRKAHFKCSKYDTLNCKANARAILEKEGDENSP